MAAVYFETSVFLAILGRQPEGPKVRGLLSELKADKIRVHTSIMTIQEVSVLSFRNGGMYEDSHSKVARIARINSVTKEIALTAAKFEAAVIDNAQRAKTKEEKDRIENNRRRKFDCFHIATAVSLGCIELYSFDDHFETYCKTAGVKLRVCEPEPRRPIIPGLIGSVPPGPTSPRP